MLKALIYVAVMLVGLYVSPLISGTFGTVYISNGTHELQTSLSFAIFITIMAFLAFIAIKWVLTKLLDFILSSRYLPERLRRKSARKQTLIGALAIAEEDWEAAESAMVKGAKVVQNPTLNYFAAARAAQHQLKIEQRDEYLKKAAQEPLADKAVITTRARYFMQQGELDRAREQLEKLKPSSKSKAPVLKLAHDIYLQQQDWEALKLILPALRKLWILDAAEVSTLEKKINHELLTKASAENYEALEKCWHWLSRHEKAQDINIAQYALGLAGFKHRDEAIKMLNKALRSDVSDIILTIIPQLYDAKDETIFKHLVSLKPKLESKAAYHYCMAYVHQLNNDLTSALSEWEILCQLTPKREYWLALAQLQEKLANNAAALASYKNAAKA